MKKFACILLTIFLIITCAVSYQYIQHKHTENVMTKNYSNDLTTRLNQDMTLMDNNYQLIDHANKAKCYDYFNKYHAKYISSNGFKQKYYYWKKANKQFEKMINYIKLTNANIIIQDNHLKTLNMHYKYTQKITKLAHKLNL